MVGSVYVFEWQCLEHTIAIEEYHGVLKGHIENIINKISDQCHEISKLWIAINKRQKPLNVSVF
jgi:hypothetical protein